MKYSIVIASVLAVANAQVNSLSACGVSLFCLHLSLQCSHLAKLSNQFVLMESQNLCVNNMIGLATNLGCTSQSDATCLCKNINFYNGLRDCSSQACSAAEAAQVVLYGQAYCGAVGVAVGGTSTGGSLTATATSGGPLATGSPESVTVNPTAGGVGAGAGAASSASGSSSSATGAAGGAVSQNCITLLT